MTPDVPVSPAADTSTADMLSVSTEVLDGVAVLHVRGEIDMASTEPLHEDISARLTNGDDVVIDCTDITFMDSSGLSALINAQASAQRRGVRLVVVANDHAVLRPLQVTGLDAALTITATTTDALALLDRRHDATPPHPRQG
ncbi:STAS domain-containing protein [Lentzea sp. NPDC051208]|uniref:STAS domain-containing protein n=1 Tax=Lentzea sp. NPDC051208 TaxID=3154642 RepID=UPI00343E94BF